MTRRIAIVQFAPKIGHVAENIEKATRLCASLHPGSIDLVCLPEMAFTGYNFPNARAIEPFLELRCDGETSQFCTDLATRLSCYVAAGYPERLADHEVQAGSDKDGMSVRKIGANSAVIYSPAGERVGEYRKTNLFDTDKSWAISGSGFKTFALPPPLGNLTLAICMDLNPVLAEEWTLEEGPYELAEYCIKHQTDTLVMLNAWLDSKEGAAQSRDWSTVNYWAVRLMPLWKSGRWQPLESQKEDILVVICNRSGSDDDMLFAGTSTIMNLTRNSDAPDILGVMTRREESVRIFTV